MGSKNQPPYYITAYGLAVKQGFIGTLEEWLESLHGNDIQLRYQGEKLQMRRSKHMEDLDPEEGWQDLIDMEGAREAIFSKARQETEKAENAARRAEEAAQQAKQSYYTTPREKIRESHDEINTAYIWGLYDALMEAYPDYVQKLVWIDETASWSTEWKDYHPTEGTFVNYQYVISTGEYPTGVYGKVHIKDEHIKKPKYLILSAIDGNERKTAFSAYRFVWDVLRGHNVPKSFKEGVILSVMPVGVPYCFDKFNRENKNGVYIERNFDCDWTPESDNGVNRGEYAASEKETQAITKWLCDNADADFYIDVHNNGAVHELTTLIGSANSATTDAAKKIALRGISNITPYWRDVIGYSQFESSTGEYECTYDENGKVNGYEWVLEKLDVIFANTASIDTSGTSIAYAQKVLGIPSLVLETSSYYGAYTEWLENKTEYPAESISMGAEAIGNILLEFYRQEKDIPLSRHTNVTPTYQGEVVLTKNSATQSQFYNEEVQFT